MTSRLVWRTLHHCVAHPLLALSDLVERGADAFHDWTAAKAFPDDTPTEARKGG